MEHERLDAGIRQQYVKCARLGKALIDNFAEENIHAFRVGVKRLRALLRLAASAEHSDITPRLPRNLRVYYHMTGIIRTLQLQKKALEEVAVRLHQGAPANCLALLDDRIGSTKRMIGEYLRIEEPWGHRLGRWAHPVTGVMAVAAEEAFIAGKITALGKKQGVALPDDEQLHALRKDIKDLLYAWPYLHGRIVEHAQEGKGLPGQKVLETCAGLLGDFHDVVLQLSLLQDKAFLLVTCPQSSKFLEAAQQCWLQDKLTLQDKLKAQLFHPGAAGENPLAPSNLNAVSYELHID